MRSKTQIFLSLDRVSRYFLILVLKYVKRNLICLCMYACVLLVIPGKTVASFCGNVKGSLGVFSSSLGVSGGSCLLYTNLGLA